MAKKFYHFGDSYADFTDDSEINFGELLSNYFKCDEYLNYGESGASNEMIFHNILKKSHQFNSDDIIFINWSFLTRTSYVTDSSIELKSTNQYIDDYLNKITHENNDIFKFLEKHSHIVEYVLYNNYDIVIKLFSGYINPFIDLLLHKNIKVISLFIDESCDLYMNKKIVTKFNNTKAVPPNTLVFNDYHDEPSSSFIQFLDSNRFHNEENGHYTSNIQGRIFELLKSIIESNIIDWYSKNTIE